MNIKSRFNKLFLLITVISSNNAFSMQRMQQVINQIIPSKVEVDNKMSIQNILSNPNDKEFIVQEVTNNFLKYGRPKTYQEFSTLLMQFDIDKDKVNYTQINQWINENFVIEAVIFKYPELASKLNSLVSDNFDKVDPLIIGLFLMHGENAASFAKLSVLSKNSFLFNYLQSISVLKTINESIISLFDIVLNKLIKALNSNSIKNEQDLVILLDELLKQENTKEYLKKHPLLEQVLSMPEHFEKLKELIYQKTYNEGGLGGADFQNLIKQLSESINAIFEIFNCVKIIIDICLQKNQIFEKALIQVAMEHAKDISKENLELIYNLTKDEKEQTNLAVSVIKYLPANAIFDPNVESIIKNIDKFGSFPNFIVKHLSDSQKGDKTQTHQHLIDNLGSVINMLTNNSGYIKGKEKFKNPKVQEFILNIHNKEKEESTKNNYVFYHGRSKDIRFSGEIYKQLWKLKYHSKLTQEQQKKFDQRIDNFIFMRFESKDKVVDERDDFFFMNHSIFGNSHETTGASTLTGYWLRDHSAHFDPDNLFSTKSLFSKKEFGLQKYYKKYKDDLDKLNELHNKATEQGEIVALSIPNDKIHLVKPCAPGGYLVTVNVNDKLTSDAKTILDALKKDPSKVKLSDGRSADYLEWKLPLDNSYALNPFEGPKFYSFYFMDEQSKKEYEVMRDQLFAKIRQDYEQDLINQAKELKRLKKMENVMSIVSAL